MNRITKEQKKVIVAMSGGVDSSVAAFFLCEQGWDVVGATIDTGFGRGPEQAEQICSQLGIPFYVIDGRQQFQEQVMRPFAEAYLNGLTPNPCVDCHRCLKFPIFFPLMDELDADKLATGHYCRLTVEENGYGLRRACFDAKDQTYFLCRLDQSVLSRCMFPLGDIDKPTVRKIAAESGLASAEQKDSFDICFLQNEDYRSCVRRFAVAAPAPGEIVDTEGRVVGQHQGLMDYTLGQRRGINVALGYPAYVVGMDRQKNRLILGPREALNADHARIERMNLLSGEQTSQPFTALVRVRYQAKPVEARIIPDLQNHGEAELRFAEPVWAPAPGQSAVFYDGDRLLGGGYLL